MSLEVFKGKMDWRDLSIWVIIVDFTEKEGKVIGI